jgi:hypothetical protein
MAGRRTYDIPLGRLFSVAPGLPTTDMTRTVEHYRRLGFTFAVFGSAPPPADAGFGIGRRDGVELHFALKPDHDPTRTATWVYISVEDADELAAELAASGVSQGRTPRDTDYGMREQAHIDPDGNLLLFGSPLREATPGQSVEAPTTQAPATEAPATGAAEGTATEALETEGPAAGAPAAGAAAGGPATEAPATEASAADPHPGADRELATEAPTTVTATEGPAAGRDLDPDPRVLEFVSVLTRGDEGRLRALLAVDPGLATSLINERTPLHLFADAPGHRPNPVGVVTALAEAGADLNAHAVGSWHHETPLHWAASNDDVELIDALLDAGADIEHPGSSIGGGPPAESALGYGQLKALRRLDERGAAMNLSRAAALGLMPLVAEFATAIPAPDGDELAAAFWNACRAGQLEAARYLAGRGADINWPAPWSGQSPLDAARASRRRAVVAWLTESGATSG